MVLYYDIFRHPLRIDELRYLVGNKAEEGLIEALAQGWVQQQDRYVFRPGHQADCAQRRERSACAERTWPRARVAAGFLARFPHVRGVLITGSLSKQSASPGSDIDFLLVVAPGRVWTVKLALQAFRKSIPAAARESLCTNYILAEDALSIPAKSMYTAIELATALPMHGPAACTALLAENPWARRFVPGYDQAIARASWAAATPQTALKSRIEGWIPASADAQAEAIVTGFWDRRYAWLPESERKRRFQRGAGVATNHLHDFTEYVTAAYATRIADAGLPEP